jgi:pimeloyl-ACP methyl ester carboxylesterase
MPIKKTILALALLGTILFIQSCFQFRTSDRKQYKELEEIQTHCYVEISAKQVDTRTIHYTLVVSDSTNPLAVFVHGSPGSSGNFIQFAKDSSLLKKYNVLLVDRPGFGYSDFGNPEPSIGKQAEILNDFLNQFIFSEKILIGHSLGGPIICRMAMNEPEMYDGMFIVAGSVSPELEPEEKWRMTLAKRWIRWILPNTLDVSNQEILPARAELEKMVQLWPKITCKVLIMQGGEDDLVPPGNADYAEEKLVNAVSVEVIRLLKENHFIPFTKPELITQALLRF